MSEADLLAGATETIRRGSKSFASAARLFAPKVREGAVMLYAWCRHCDDVVDGQDLGFRRQDAGPGPDPAARLVALERQTRAALAGEATDDPAFAGLAAVARRFAVPERYPLQHLDGFRMDIDGRRYRTLADTLDYCYGVAGVVGLMMAHVMGVRDPAVLDRACDLGLAFQLTNIARDLVEDAEVGRVYLPADWLREAGLSAEPAAVADPANRTALAVVAARLVAAAEPYYASAAVGIAHLPARSAWAIATARGVYRAIGTEVVRRGPRAWDERVSTSKAAKITHALIGALATLPLPRPSPPRPRELYVRPDLHVRPA